jgi:RNA polymerase sigma-70 factor (ECF subfamily)
MCGCTGFVLRLVRNEATAEDLISEVFLDIWRQAGKFEGRSAVSTWILSIADTGVPIGN